MSSSSSFPLDPPPELSNDLAVLFTNADDFKLFDQPRNFICGVAGVVDTGVSMSKSRYFFLFEDVLLVTKADDRRRWDEGAYLILARLDLADVHVRKEGNSKFSVHIEGLGQQHLQLRDEQSLNAFLERLRKARALRLDALSPRSRGELSRRQSADAGELSTSVLSDSSAESLSRSPSPAPSRAGSRKPSSSSQTLLGPDMEDDYSEELDARLGRLSDLVNMVSHAYAQDGFLSQRDTYVMVMQKDKQAEALALQTLQKSVLGTPLESDALSKCKSLDEACKLLGRQLSQADVRAAAPAAVAAASSAELVEARARNVELERRLQQAKDEAAAARRLDERTQQLQAEARAQTQRADDAEQAAARHRDEAARMSAALAAEAARSHAAAERRMREAEALGQSYRDSLNAERARADLLTQQLLDAKQAQLRAAQDALRLEEERAQLQRELEARRDTSLLLGSSAEQDDSSRSLVAVATLDTPVSTVLSASSVQSPAALPEHDESASAGGSLGEFAVALDGLDDILRDVSLQTPVITRRAEQEEREAAAIQQRGGSFASPVASPAAAPVVASRVVVAAAAPVTAAKDSAAERELSTISAQLRAIVAEYADTSRASKQQSNTPAQNLQRIRDELESLRGTVDSLKREEGARVHREQVDASQLRSQLRAAEAELEKARKENEMLRVTSGGAVASAATALQGGPASTERADLVEAHKRVRRLEAELEESRVEAAKQRALAVDAQQRARQERTKVEKVGASGVEAAETALHLSHARKATEDVRRVWTRQDGVRRQLASTLTTAEAVALMEQHSRALDAALRALEAQVGIESAGSSSSSNAVEAAVKSPRAAGAAEALLKSPRSSTDTAADVRIQSLKLENSRLEQALNDATSDLADVRGKLDSERQAREEATRLLGIEKGRVAFAETKLDERLANERQLQDACDKLQSAKARLEQQLAAEKSRCDALAAELALAQAAHSRVDQEHAELRARSAAAADGAHRLEQQLAAEKARCDSLAAELAATQTTKVRLDQEHVELRARSTAAVDEAHTAKARLEQQLADEKARGDALAAQLEETRTTKLRLDQEHAELRARSSVTAGEAETAKARLDQQLAAEVARCDALAGELAVARAQQQGLEEELGKERERRATEVQSLHAAVEEARRMTEQVLDMEKQRSAKLEAERSAAASQDAQQQAALNAELAKRTAELASARQDVTTAAAALAALQASLQSERELTASLRKGGGEAAAKETRLEALNRALQNKVFSVEQEIDKSLDELDIKTAEFEATQTALAEAQSALAAERQRADQQTAEARALQQRLQDGDAAVQRAEQQLRASEQEKAQMRASLDAFQKALGVADATLAAEQQRAKDALELQTKDAKRVEATNKALQERNLDLQQELLRAQDAVQAKHRALEASLANAAAAEPPARALEERTATLQQELTQARDALRDEQKRGTKFATDLNQSTAELSRVQRGLEEATRNTHKFETLLAAEKVRVSALSREVEMRRTAAEDASAMRDQLDEERERAMALSTEIVVLKRAVDEAKRDRATLELALSKAREQSAAAAAVAAAAAGVEAAAPSKSAPSKPAKDATEAQQRYEKGLREAAEAKEAQARAVKSLAVAQTDLEEARAEATALKVQAMLSAQGQLQKEKKDLRTKLDKLETNFAALMQSHRKNSEDLAQAIERSSENTSRSYSDSGMSDSDSDVHVVPDKDSPRGAESRPSAGAVSPPRKPSLDREPKADAELRAQVAALQERLEQEERRSKLMQETNKVLIVRLNEARAEIQSTKK